MWNSTRVIHTIDVARLLTTIASFSYSSLLCQYAIHKPHLPNGELTVYRGISGEQFHGSKAS